MGNDTSKHVDLESKLEKIYSTSPFKSDIFDELTFEVTRQRKFVKMPWIPYKNFKDIMYINKDDYINYSARMKSKPNRIKDIKIFLKELINSEKMTKDELKLVNIFIYFFFF
jgi:hypothetical protein